MKRFCVLLAGHARRVVKLTAFALVFVQTASAALTNRYVIKDNAGSAVPYDAWANAAADIQTAINYAYAGETVLVAAATYDTGGMTNYPAGTVLTNRVVINKAITVRSATNDPVNTIIKGAKDNGTNGPASVRCVYMTNGSALIGFTLTNGATLPTSAVLNDQYGGGVSCQSTNAIISNCVLTGNSAQYGGGSWYGTLYNCTLFTNVAMKAGGGSYNSYLYTCTLTNNVANGGSGLGGGGANACFLDNCTIVGNAATSSSGSGMAEGGGVYYANMHNCRLYNNYSSGYTGGAHSGKHTNCTFIGNSAGGAGGGAMYATLYNCVIISNFSSFAGGVYSCPMYNCTVVNNLAYISGGGALSHVGPGYDWIVNCIIYSNTSSTGNGPNWASGISNVFNSCTIGGTGQVDFVTNGNITNPPVFVNWHAGNYRQSANSPGVNAGSNISWMTDSSDVRSKDLDGHPRIDGFYRIVDMGAYEYLPSGAVFGGL